MFFIGMSGRNVPKTMIKVYTWCEVIRCGGDFTYRGQIISYGRAAAGIRKTEAARILRLVTGLDQGEHEAIVITDERKADILLMEETEGSFREMAYEKFLFFQQ